MSSDRKMGHLQEPKTYFLVLLALMVLTIITVWVSLFDFGMWNNLVAVLVATVKASLVVRIFMHGRFEDRITWAFIYYPLILLLLLLGALFLDYGFRSDADRVVDAPSITHTSHGEEHGAEETHPEKPEDGDDEGGRH